MDSQYQKQIPTLQYILDLAGNYFGFKIPEFLSKDAFNLRKEYTPVSRMIIESFIPYFNYRARFNMENTIEALKESDFNFPEFDEGNLIRLFEYCNKCGFIRRKQTNVAS